MQYIRTKVITINNYAQSKYRGSRPRRRPKWTWREVVKKFAKQVIWTRRMLWIMTDGRSW